jgi:ABC-type dipeptide/oligopeptide/nickel transport system permease component
VTTATFILIHLAPGDPIGGGLDDPRVPEAVRAHWRAVYGLDQPLTVQFVRYLAGAARGHFASYYTMSASRGNGVARRLPRMRLEQRKAEIRVF